jgi:hypothetical protein
MHYDKAWLRARGFTLDGDTARRLADGADFVRRAPQAQPADHDIPEGTLLAKIRALATPYGWLIYHTYDSRKSEPGFPDTVMTDGTSLLIYELKDNHRKPTHEQETWLNLLAHTGKVECGIWRPRDLPAITERLTRRSHP